MRVVEKFGLGLFLIGLAAFIIIPFIGTYSISEELVLANTKEIHQQKMTEILAPMYGQNYSSNFAFLSAFGENFDSYNESLKDQQLWDQVIWDDYSFALALAGLKSPVRENPWIFFMLSIGLAVVGGFLYNFRQHHNEPAGIKNNGIFHSSLKNRGILGMLTGTFLIVFYIGLYWFPAYLVTLVWMVSPISELLSGNPASQWFLYGLIYTLAILVMGVRMFRKYRGNKYQQLRTASVMFFRPLLPF